MTTSFYNGIGGTKSFQVGVDTLGYNISNINTVGFKQQETSFTSLFSKTLSTSLNSVVNSDVGVMSAVTTTTMDLSQGAIQQTDNVFDFAVEGKGWIAVSDQNGLTQYTRTGSFHRDQNGTLVTQNGEKLLLINANNLKFEDNMWKFDSAIPTDNLIDSNKELSSINLPDNIIFPPQPTKKVKIGGNLSNQNIAPTPKVATSNSDFGVLYDSHAQNMNIKDKQDVVFGFGDNIKYEKGVIKYEMCISDDEIDGEDLNIDFNVNGENIKLTLPDGSKANEIVEAITKELENKQILYENTSNSIEIQSSDKLIIKNNNTPFLNSASMQKLVYSSNPTKENEFNTMQNFIDKLNLLADEVYQNVDVTLQNGQIKVNNNNSNVDIKTILSQGDNSNDLFMANLDMIGNIIKPLSSASSLTFNQNYQGFNGDIIDAKGNRNKLQFDFYKTKIENNITTWNLTISEIDNNGSVVSTTSKDITFDKTGGLLTPTDIEIDNNGIKTNINLGGAFNGITSIDKPNVGFAYSQDGFEEGYLVNYDVNENGEIIATFSNSKAGVLGQIPLYHFQNEQGLDNVGGNLYTPTSNSGKAFLYDVNGDYIAGAKIANYALEMSNVNLAQAMTEIIVMQKAFDANSKSITTSDQMIKKAIDMKR